MTQAGTSVAVQQLRICVPNAGDTGSIPGQGTKIPLAAHAKKQTNKQTKDETSRTPGFKEVLTLSQVAALAETLRVSASLNFAS